MGSEEPRNARGRSKRWRAAGRNWGGKLYGYSDGSGWGNAGEYSSREGEEEEFRSARGTEN